MDKVAASQRELERTNEPESKGSQRFSFTKWFK